MELSLSFLLLLFSVLLNIYLLFSPLQIYVYLEGTTPKIPKHLQSPTLPPPNQNQNQNQNQNLNQNQNQIVNQNSNGKLNVNSNQISGEKDTAPLIISSSALTQLTSPFPSLSPLSHSPSSKFSSPFSTQLLPFDQIDEGWKKGKRANQAEKGKEDYSMRDYHYPIPFENYAPSEHFLAISPFGGLNNQLDHLYYQIGWARALGRTLVLPLFSGSHHAHDRGFYPIELFLDLYELAKVVKLIKWDDFVQLCDQKMDAVVALDKIRKRLDIFRTFEIMEYYNMTVEREIVLEKHQKPITSWNIRDAFEIHGVNQLRCVILNGINKFDDYDRKSFVEDNLYFQIRNAVRIALYARHAAAQWIDETFKGQRFLAVHFRRGDFFEYCTRNDIAIYPFVHQANLLSGEGFSKLEKGVTERPGCYPTLEEAIRDITYVARKCKVNSIFLSTNAEEEEFTNITTALGEKYRIAKYTGGLDFAANVLSTIDISINSMADCFLGNKYSSFSFTILTKRRQLETPKSWKTAYLY